LVEERRREIGIRLALDAKPMQVIAPVPGTSQATALALCNYFISALVF